MQTALILISPEVLTLSAISGYWVFKSITANKPDNYDVEVDTWEKEFKDKHEKALDNIRKERKHYDNF